MDSIDCLLASINPTGHLRGRSCRWVILNQRNTHLSLIWLDEYESVVALSVGAVRLLPPLREMPSGTKGRAPYLRQLN